ncbi:glycosyltransferase family 2 protein [uncultured Acetatifactor sp.]|jgi:glycosyltransferase involved in cell wall biosynthesis|uniref:glycosyltransferase family 2 protein n=1 Tax=uncultured Acetatifactor sp. TaxID=1671927 RepID=UPI0025E098DF|nr:glycosyltransferase family 2 protein [uncultured Acetatifactor sp.]MCI8696420.1 glycosyltransferase family 2 protein [Lachnospiraceae bacterium]MCI9231688.1 glycosyltransferase family 2 protein [Lachnospiraceae bacterium]MCI9573907.1 glycosyltransferase family 2 protein [Lachnospiraceae bacterium]MCI9651968.1 glycosyltransferase family 2 protein [Lachnospiraceae bacterium]
MWKMVTISLCMIVKNEEKILERCLDSVADLVDEIVIADTGSTDATREIARRYTEKVYDFPWTDDFSAARNFVFSRATQEYIYSADADEVLSPENRERFRLLKETLLPEVEIVQMKYANQLQFNTVYNYDEEYRPKLFKRKRDFVWEAPIHETVRLEPVIYDSDIVITHLPGESHAKRDLANFQKHWRQGYRLPKRLLGMYARELLIAGDEEDFAQAAPVFLEAAADNERDGEEMAQSCCVAARAARLAGDTVSFFKYTSKVIAEEACSEICCEMGHFYEGLSDWEEAAIWYYNAVYETRPILALQSGGKESLEGLIRCYEALGCPEQADIYREELRGREGCQ